MVSRGLLNPWPDAEAESLVQPCPPAFDQLYPPSSAFFA
jgi:hypothetical protein